MQLPHSSARTAYIEQIKIIEANLKDATSGEKDEALLKQTQKRLDTLAEKYQYNEAIGTARYKLYELQALVHYFRGNDDDALDFINQAIETRGDNYARAEKIKKLLLAKNGIDNSEQHSADSTPPLQLQALIKGQRSSAIIMAVISALSIYFIPWSIFYIILAVKLDSRRIPNRGLIKAAAISTLPLCFGIIPIIIDVEFWKTNKYLKEYETQGVKAFISNEEWLADEPRRKRRSKVAWSILLSVIVVVIALVVSAIASSNSPTQESAAASLADNAVQQFKSSSTLPQKVDDITTLTDITAAGSALQYHYQIEGADVSNLSDEVLYRNIQPNVCSNTDTRKILDAGVMMQYLYTVADTNQYYTVNVQSSDCT